MLKRLRVSASDSTDVIRFLQCAHAIDEMIFKYVKKFLTFFGFGLFGDRDDKRLRVKLLLPGLDHDWNNACNDTGSYKNRSEENNKHYL